MESRCSLLAFVLVRPSMPTLTMITARVASVTKRRALTLSFRIFIGRALGVDTWLGSQALCCDTDQAGNIENQCDGAVAQDRGAGNPVDTPEIGFERFDDDLLLAEEIVDEETDAAALAFDDH